MRGVRNTSRRLTRMTRVTPRGKSSSSSRGGGRVGSGTEFGVGFEDLEGQRARARSRARAKGTASRCTSHDPPFMIDLLIAPPITHPPITHLLMTPHSHHPPLITSLSSPPLSSPLPPLQLHSFSSPPSHYPFRGCFGGSRPCRSFLEDPYCLRRAIITLLGKSHDTPSDDRQSAI